MAHVGVSVDESTKDRWQQYLDQSDCGSMSELIRQAVNKEIQRGGANEAVPQTVERELTQMAEQQETLKQRMLGLSDQFDDVADSIERTEYPKEVVELGHEIGSELEEMSALQWQEGVDQHVQQLAELQEKYDANGLGQVEDALQYLEENLSYVESFPKGPSDYYRIKGPQGEPEGRYDV